MVQINELSILIRLILGALATFFAILVWSRTRNPSWILVVIGILLYYVNIVIETLEGFGIIGANFLMLSNVPVAGIVLENLPILFFILGLVVFVIRKKV